MINNNIRNTHQSTHTTTNADAYPNAGNAKCFFLPPLRRPNIFDIFHGGFNALPNFISFNSFRFRFSHIVFILFLLPICDIFFVIVFVVGFCCFALFVRCVDLVGCCLSSLNSYLRKIHSANQTAGKKRH